MCVSAPKLPLNQCNTAIPSPDSNHFQLFPAVSKASWSVCPFLLTLETDDKHDPKFVLGDVNPLPLCCTLSSVLVFPQYMTMIGLCSRENFYWVYFFLFLDRFLLAWLCDWLNHVCCFYLLLSFCTLLLPLTQPTIWELGVVSEQLRRRRSASWRIFSNNNVLVGDWFLYFVTFQTFWHLDWFLSVHTSDKWTWIYVTLECIEHF